MVHTSSVRRERFLISSHEVIPRGTPSRVCDANCEVSSKQSDDVRNGSLWETTINNVESTLYSTRDSTNKRIDMTKSAPRMSFDKVSIACLEFVA